MSINKKMWFLLANQNQSHLNHKHTYSEHHYDSEVGYERLFSDIEKLVLDPPKTWDKYADSPSRHMDIIQMELIEMQNAHMAMKTSTGTHSDYLKELKHLAAAVVTALHDMSCKYKND